MSTARSPLAADSSVAGFRSIPARRAQARLSPWRILLVYTAVAGLWIAFSDTALTQLVRDPTLRSQLGLYKGFAFVAVTALLLYWLLRRSRGLIDQSFEQLRQQRCEIERFNRLYRAFSAINHEVMVAETRQDIYTSICDVLVEQGGFRMAWVGLLDNAGARLQPVASAGQGIKAVINDLKLRAEVSAGSVGWDQVIAAGQAMVCNDFSRSDDTRHWRELAARHHLRSRAALPLREASRVIGVLSVYADENGFFRDRELALLEEVVVDVSSALEKFSLEEKRGHAELLAGRELAFSQAMIDSMPGIVYFYDESGRFLRWNRNFETVSGYRGEEIARMHPLQFFDEPDQSLVSERINRALVDGEASVEADFLSRDGSKHPYYFTGRGLDYDGQRCLVGVGVDISERKQAEAALRDLNDSLERRVAERTEQLESAVQRAESADRLKSAFLATMSHELRTPLNSIIGFTGIILQELAGPLTEEQAKQLGMVQGSARHLLELINDVLDLSKIEAGQLDVRAEPFSPTESLQRVLDSVTPQLEKKGLELAVDVSSALPGMRSDRRRFEQILLNLVNNAIKFTDAGRVAVSAQRQPGYLPPGVGIACEALRLTVADTGIGIRVEDQGKLFQPFHQLDSGLTRKHDGTGLGLMICRRLAELMGGEIRLRSEWGRGSEFTVLLPLDAPEPV
ncbi:MAG: hypothetical protein CME40_02435 [Haliea sp.]|nr:hypothetical protein [Haliea sp.]MAL93931.1 hypothetical protein [Haliea sp.]|tara:strand:+ start:5376 stop:7424 length:2049 start_codon:yes stop_codon:yes gene_type:complete